MSATTRRIIIGREYDCDVLLEHISVSRKHAELLVCADGSLELSDLHSLGGTYILRSGEIIPVYHSPLKSADTVRFGEFDISVPDLISLFPEAKPEPKRCVKRVLIPLPSPPLRNAQCDYAETGV